MIVRLVSVGGGSQHHVTRKPSSASSSYAPGCRSPSGEHSPDVPTWLALTFAHRACWAEGRAKGFLARRGEPSTEEEFRAEIVRLKRELTRETNRADRERGMHLGWKEAYAAAGGLPCAFCAQEIRPYVRAADFGLGALDDDGFLTIVGRKKEIIITAGGKNVAPALLEDRLRAHPLISQAMVVGDAQPFIATLITISASENG